MSLLALIEAIYEPNLIDEIRGIYERVTGRDDFDDLPPEVVARIRFLPPEATMDDIEFALDPPPHLLAAEARRQGRLN
jgi:hypothetical protein